MSKTKITAAVKRINEQRQAREEAARSEAEQHDKLLMLIGEIIEAAAIKPRSKWYEWRNRPLVDLLVEIGLEESPTSHKSDADGSDGDSVSETGPTGPPPETGSREPIRMEPSGSSR